MKIRFAFLLVMVGLIATVSSCTQRTLNALNPCLINGVAQNVPVNPQRALDVLFIIDDSASMRDEQAKLAEHGLDPDRDVQIRSVPPTEQEIRDYYEATKPQQPKRPATVSFRAIVVSPQPTPEAKAAARAKADSVLAEIRMGADFATLARRFSDDPGSREEGGDLGWFRRGRMVAAFEQVAFRLRPGQVSEVVETPFGFHIIQVERIEPAEIKARHILFAPVITDADLARAQARADSAATALRAGTPVDSLLRLYHDPLEQSLFEDIPPDNLPEALRNAVQGALPGDVIGPVRIEENGRIRFAAVLFEEARAEGEYTYEELYDRLRSSLSEGSGVRRYVDELRKNTYIDIRF